MLYLNENNQLLDGQSIGDFLVTPELRMIQALKRRLSGLEIQKSLHERFTPCPYSVKDWDLLYLSHKHALEMALYRLVNNSVVSNTPLLMAKLVFKSIPSKLEDHSRLLFGQYYPKRDLSRKKLASMKKRYVNCLESDNYFSQKVKEFEFEVNFIEHNTAMARQSCLQARRYELLQRLKYEVSMRVKDGWYLVFNTLTVDTENINRVFKVGSRDFSNYVRKFEREVAQTSFGSYRMALKQDKDWHLYFAVVERGSESGRLHIHCLHLCRSLPKGCSDPNFGTISPKNREIVRLKKFWKFGYSSPIAVRFDNSDAYARLGWRWPSFFEGKIERPVMFSTFHQVVGYMGKYLTKELQTPYKKEVYSWRVRMTRGLGTLPLRVLMTRLTDSQLQLLMLIPTTKRLKFLDKPIPRTLLRVLATRELVLRKFKSDPRSVCVFLNRVKARSGFVLRLRLLIAGKHGHSRLNFGDYRIEDLLATEGFNVLSVLRQVECQFFPPRRISIVSAGGSLRD